MLTTEEENLQNTIASGEALSFQITIMIVELQRLRLALCDLRNVNCSSKTGDTPESLAKSEGLLLGAQEILDARLAELHKAT